MKNKMKIKSFAKVNIFLKITGTRDNYHEIISRFVIVDNLFDEISFVLKDENDKKNNTKDVKKNNNFVLQGVFGCQTHNNTIFKAYKELCAVSSVISLKIFDFFSEYKVDVAKNIPEFAGLGGGSSNAAAFLILTNSVLNLGLSTKDLADIGSKIGADVAFFVYGYKSANVSGIGEIVEEFREDGDLKLEFEIFTPQIKCDTALVYKTFRENYMKSLDINFANNLSNMQSYKILENYTAQELNDLYKSALLIYPELKNYQNNNFFSGSGSSFFKVKKQG